MAKGVVGKINVKDNGNWKRYSFALKGQDGWYSGGFDPLPFVEGETIEFQMAKNSKGYEEVDRSTIRKLVGEEAVAAQPVAQVAGSGGGFRKAGFGGRPFGKSPEEKDYWAKREARDIQTQKRIEIQSCRNSAIALVEVLLASGVQAVKLPAKEAAREGVVVEMVKRYTDMFLKENSGEDGQQNEVKAEVEVKEADAREEVLTPPKKAVNDDLGW